MTKQNALDELEAAVLDDIFGGHTAEAMSVRIGLLNINLTGKAQKIINEMEAFLTPILDDNGFVSVQKMTENGIQIPDFISMPDAKFRPIDLYRIFSPVVRKIKGSLI